MIKNLIIIWGVDDFNTLGLIREIGKFESNILFVILGRKNVASKSKYCNSKYVTKTIEEGAAYILKNFSNFEVKPIIITNCDSISVYMSRHVEDFANFYYCGSKIRDVIARFTDKEEMIKLATKTGINCPESMRITKQSLFDSLKISYPCLVKPAHEQNGQKNEFKFKIVNSKLELVKIMNSVRDNSEFVLQTYIQKDYDALLYGVRFANGDVAFAGCLKRIRTTLSGSTSFGYISKEIPDSIDVEKIKTFLTHCDYVGLFSFEYAVKDNSSYYLETNFRNDGTSHHFFQCGANLPLAFIYDCGMEKYDDFSLCVKRNGIYFDELFDFINVLKKKVTFEKYKIEKKQADVFQWRDPSDLKPFYFMKNRRLYYLFKMSFLYRHRQAIVKMLDRIHRK